MKKVFAVLLSALIFLSFSAHAEEFDLSGMTDDQLRNLRTHIDSELSNRQAERVREGGVLLEGSVGDYYIALLNIELSEDYKGDPALILTIQYTNNSDSTEPYMTAVSTKVFQNGVQVESAISVNGVDGMKQMLDVQPNASIELKKAYILTDTSSPVDIEFSKLFDFSSNPQKVVGTFNIE